MDTESNLRRRIDRRAFLSGALVGSALFLGYLFQTWGLSYTTATKSGLITGLSVVIVPVISSGAVKKRVHISVWLGALLAIVGLSLLILGKGAITTINLGDVLT